MHFNRYVARDYVEGMWLMLQQPHPDDFVLATGETHMVREFVNKSFKLVGMELRYAPHVFLCGIKPYWVLVGQGPASRNKGLTSNLARWWSRLILIISDRLKSSAYLCKSVSDLKSCSLVSS
jgi:hypothetical protein